MRRPRNSRVHGCEGGGQGWADCKRSRRLVFVMQRGHRDNGSQAVNLETVPSKEFQPWSTSFIGGWLPALGAR